MTGLDAVIISGEPAAGRRRRWKGWFGYWAIVAIPKDVNRVVATLADKALMELTEEIFGDRSGVSVIVIIGNRVGLIVEGCGRDRYVKSGRANDSGPAINMKELVTVINNTISNVILGGTAVVDTAAFAFG